MKNKILLTAFIFLMSTLFVAGQQGNTKTKATSVVMAKSMKIVPSIASKIADGTFIPGEIKEGEINKPKKGGNKVVPGKGLPIGKDPLRISENDRINNPSSAPIISWDGAGTNVQPSDPTGAAGVDHYINAWNTSYRIWDKEGNSLIPASSLSNLWPGETDGDPIVLYDKFADRFIITQFYGVFTTSPGFLIAICQGSDPVNDDWYTYEFPVDYFPDYPKFSVWSDGYYITANYNAAASSADDNVFVIDRDKVIAGDETAEMIGFPLSDISYSGWFCPLGFNANGAELPPTGNAPIVYFQDQAWAGVSTDHLKVWTIDVDWETPANSTITAPLELETEPFTTAFAGGFWDNLEQPSGPNIGVLSGFLMQLAQYRRFSDHNSVVMNHSVNLDANDDLSGIRWYELRQDNDGDDWYIYQEGTHENPDGHNAWLGSIAMDHYGNIGLAYSVVSPTQTVSIRYTGRYADDPLNQMTIVEDTLQAAVDNNSSFRYGDYSQLTLDPVDDETFWHISEYFNGNRKSIISAFKLAPSLNIDAAIVAINSPTDGTLTASEVVTVSIRNFGIDTLFNVPVSYSVDGGTVYSEVYADTILSNTTVQYAFTATEDFSILENVYAITAYTAYDGDEYNENDTLITEVMHLLPNDIGAATVLDPTSGSGLSAAEMVTVKIDNYGGATQIDFELSYVVNGGTPVTEIVAGPLEGPGTMLYTFTQAADLSALGSYEITAYTSLAGDSDMMNDTTSKTVANIVCTPSADCSVGDGFELFQLTTINNSTGCSDDGYGDFTDQMAQLYQGSTNDLTVTTGYGSQYVNVWVDLNDNFVYEADELIVDNLLLGSGQGSGTFTETTDFILAADAALGEHLMRAKSNWNAPVSDDACEGSTYGETEDYKVNIDFDNSIGNNPLQSSSMTINTLPNNQFEAILSTKVKGEQFFITVHNTAGQRLIYDLMTEVNGDAYYDFDMSYTAPGVYLVRVGTATAGKVQKIVVK